MPLSAFTNVFAGNPLDRSSYRRADPAWVSGQLFTTAAKAGGLGANGSTPTSAQLVTGLNSLKTETLDGLAPNLTFTSGQPHPDDCWYTFALKNGQWSLPNGTKTTCETAAS